MKKSVVMPLFYALFMILGHGRGVVTNAQASGLNPYDGNGMKGGIDYAASQCGTAGSVAVTGWYASSGY